MKTMTLKRDLATLIGFPTVSNRPLTDLAAWLANRSEDLGLSVERFPDPTDPGKCSLICTVGPQTGQGIVLSGHMDVVPTEGQPWSTDPFELTEKDGRYYGRGTADMKGFFAATLQAISRINLAELKNELTLIWTHDEEVGCLGSAALVDAWPSIGRPLPRACLIGEPTDFQVLRMHPGHVAIEVTTTGQAAHSSQPDLGHNAIEDVGKVIAVARELANDLMSEKSTDLPEMERPWVAFNTAQVRGGSAVNIVPDQCALTIGYRPLPGMNPLEVFHRLQQRIEDLALKHPAHMRVLRVTPAMLTEAGTALQKTLHSHASCSDCGAATFATDGGNLAKLGLQPLVFGPGQIEVAHQADEFVPTDQLEHSVDVVEAVIRSHCQ